MSLSKIKSLAGDTVVYGLAAVISRMISIFLVPLYTRIFTPSDFGTIQLINVTFFLINLFCILAMDVTTARWYYDTEDETERKKAFSNWFFFQLTISICFCFLLIALTNLSAKYLLDLPVREIKYLWFLPCLTLITNVIPFVLGTWFKLRRKAKATVVFTLSQSITTIILTVLFVLKFEFGIMGVYLALFLSSSIFSIIGVFQIKSWISLTYFNLAYLKGMLKYALPFAPGLLTYWLLTSTDAYFIKYFKGSEEVGLFSIGASLASGVSLITFAFQQAWNPFALSIHNEPDAKKTYASVFLIYGVLSSVAILGMFLFATDILHLLTTEKFFGASWVASILTINIILIAIIDFAALGIAIKKKNKIYLFSSLLAAVTTIILDIVLIPYFGKEGSAFATVCAQLFMVIFLFIYSQKIYKIDYDFVKVILLVSSAILIGIFSSFYFSEYHLNNIFIKAIILALFSISIIFVFRSALLSIVTTFKQKK